MIKFYYHPSPNPLKVALFLEEAGMPYELMAVDTRKGEQHSPAFLKINPNGKTPAITDGDVTVFDSNAILLYLAEKSGQFLPENTSAARAQMLSWLMFVASGIGPYSGQAVHFQHAAPEKNAYAINRYTFEAERHFKLLDDQLSKHKYMLGNTYTLVDTAVWGWARALCRGCLALMRSASCRMSNDCSTRSTHAQPPSVQRACRRSSTSRWRWTTKRSVTCLQNERLKAWLVNGCRPAPGAGDGSRIESGMTELISAANQTRRWPSFRR